MSDPLYFGGYKGVPLNAVPTGYLRWVVRQGWVDYRVRQDCALELECRKTTGWRPKTTTAAPPPPPIPLDVNLTLVTDIITTGYRLLSKRHHPDTGGSTETMQQLNRAIEWLRTTVKAALTRVPGNGGGR